MMMMKIKRGVSLLLTVLMLVQMMPVNAMAEGWNMVRSAVYTAPATYTVTFNVNGETTATVNVENRRTVGSNMPADPTAEEGQMFVGWYTSDGVRFTKDTIVTGSLTVSARFNTASYTITFDTNGGSLVAPKTVSAGDRIYTETPDPNAGQPTCGYEEHTHDETCYTGTVMNCDKLAHHHHAKYCYTVRYVDEQGNLISATDKDGNPIQTEFIETGDTTDTYAQATAAHVFGYTLQSAENTKGIMLCHDEAENVIEFTYRKNQTVTITIKHVDKNRDTLKFSNYNNNTSAKDEAVDDIKFDWPAGEEITIPATDLKWFDFVEVHKNSTYGNTLTFTPTKNATVYLVYSDSYDVLLTVSHDTAPADGKTYTIKYTVNGTSGTATATWDASKNSYVYSGNEIKVPRSNATIKITNSDEFGSVRYFVRGESKSGNNIKPKEEWDFKNETAYDSKNGIDIAQDTLPHQLLCQSGVKCA